MSFNIEVKGGSSVRLPTAGKYCDRDIVITAEGGGGGGEEAIAAFLGNTMTELDSNVTSIVGYACRGLTRLKTVNLPNVTSIGTYAFYGCTSMSSFNAPNVTTLSGHTFRGCSRLTSIDLPELTTCGDNEFYGTAVPTLYLPKLTNCDTYTFSTMKSSKVILPAMKTIASNAFRGASIVTVDLASCTNIEETGFNQCGSLAHLILRADTMCVLANTSAFTATPITKGTGYVYVPSALIETYKTATNWSTFANQFRAIEDYLEICGV